MISSILSKKKKRKKERKTIKKAGKRYQGLSKEGMKICSWMIQECTRIWKWAACEVYKKHYKWEKTPYFNYIKLLF